MANYLQYSHLILLLVIYVDQGDGRLKKPTKDTLKHDLKLYKKMFEKINTELQSFYEEYPNDPSIDYYQDELNNIQKIVENKQIENKKKYNNNIDMDLNTKHNKDEVGTSALSGTVNQNASLMISNKINIEGKNQWPKFEDILKAMGKMYDWKNDRWIKIKEKIKDDTKATSNSLQSAPFHEKHKFKYRIVKLNRTKSKRNIVIAVTAVR